MLSQRLLARLDDTWTQPTLAALFQDWWYLIVLSMLAAAIVLWMAVQLIKADLELRRSVRAMAHGEAGEEAMQNIAYFRTRRRAIIRPILLSILVLFFAAYPVLKSWYGLE
jgi:sterol desaturase/sphingolipid hydroxylase (fatty acid hydroxylase superfamily)